MHKLTEIVKQRLYQYIILGIWLLSIIPFFVLSFYNHPSADDYNYADVTRHMWINSHSVIKVCIEAVKESVHKWNTWQGLYSSSTFLSLQPAIYGERLYCLTGIIMLCTIIFMNIFFFVYLLNHKLQIRRSISIATALLSSFIMLQWMPNVNEGLYWYNGAVNYSFFYAIYMLLICGGISILFNKNGNYPIWKVVVIAIVAFILEGGNHVTALLGVEIGVIMVVVALIMKNREKMRNSIIIASTLIIGFLLNVLSPGTKVRQAAVEREREFSYDPVRSVYLSITNGVDLVSEWLTPDILIFLLLVMPLLVYLSLLIVKTVKYKFSHPLIVLVLSFGLHCSMLCPPLYAMGTTGEGRLTDIVFYDFVLVLILNIVYVLCFIMKRINITLTDIWSETCLESKISIVTLVVTLFFFWGLKYGMELNGYHAAQILHSGEAKIYSQECMERDRILQAAGNSSVIVLEYKVKPNFIYRTDVTNDISNWKNQGVSRYYNLKDIKIQN